MTHPIWSGYFFTVVPRISLLTFFHDVAPGAVVSILHSTGFKFEPSLQTRQNEYVDCAEHNLSEIDNLSMIRWAEFHSEQNHYRGSAPDFIS